MTMPPVLPLKFEPRPRPPLTARELAYVRGKHPFVIVVSLVASVLLIAGATLVEYAPEQFPFWTADGNALRTVLAFGAGLSMGVFIFSAAMKSLRFFRVVKDREAEIISGIIAELGDRSASTAPR